MDKNLYKYFHRANYRGIEIRERLRRLGDSSADVSQFFLFFEGTHVQHFLGSPTNRVPDGGWEKIGR